MNIYFAIPGGIFIILLLTGFLYCKNSMVAMRLLDLKVKTPIFNMINEITSSLIQVRILGRRLALLH